MTQPQIAPLAQRVWAQSLFELRTTLSNAEQLFLSFALPIGALVVLALTDVVTVFGYSEDQRNIIAASAGLGLSIAASAFTGQAIATGFDRRYGVLRQLATTPLGTTGLILAKIVSVYMVTAVQLAVTFIVIALLPVDFQLTPSLPQLLGIFLAWLLGTAALTALALAFAGTARAEAVLAGSNILWVAGAGVGGLVVKHPGVWGTVASLTPFGALGDSLRTALVAGSVDWSAQLVLLVWAVLGIIAGATWFSFESK